MIYVKNVFLPNVFQINGYISRKFCIKFGLNPSFGSRDRVQRSCFWSKFDLQSAGVTLKIMSLSPKANQFFPIPQ